MSKTYDPEIASAAAELWEKLATYEGEDADAQLIIEASMRAVALPLANEIVRLNQVISEQVAERRVRDRTPPV